MQSPGHLWFFLALCGFGAAAAQPAAPPSRAIRFVPFKGLPTAAVVQQQVADILCERAACTGSPKATVRAPVAAPAPDFVVAGQLTRSKGAGQLLLTVTASSRHGEPPGPPIFRQWVPLTTDLSGLQDPHALTAALETAMGLSREAAPQPVAAEEKPSPVAEPMPPLVTGEAPRAPALQPRSPDSPPQQAADLLLLHAGLEALTRAWGYSDLQVRNLRGFRSGLVPMPTVHVELRPLSRAGPAWLAGLALEGGYAMSVGLSSSQSNGPEYPTSITRIDAGLRYRAPGLVDGKLSFTAFGGYRIEGFKVSAAKDGTTLVGLPSPTYSSARAGAGASFRFGAVSAFLEAAALPVLGTGELQKSYFPKTSGLGLEGQLGADITFTPLLGLRVAAHATRYALTFKTVDTDQYVASSATDLYAGGTVALRVAY